MSKKGFTLMEILITITLLGILIGFGLPSFNKVLEKGRARNARANLMAIHAACEIYHANSNSVPAAYPSSCVDLAAINAGLQLNISDTSFTYTLTNGVNSYTATAARNGGAYSYTVDQTPLSSTNPSCPPGTCPI